VALVALTAWFVYALLAFGYRTYAQLRATGKTGFVGFALNQAPQERMAGALFALALVLGFVAPVLGMTLPAQALFRALLAGPTLTFAGSVLYAAGLCATLAAQFAMGPSWRIGVDASEETELVVHGPFTLVRNPIFSAMALTGSGLVLLFPSWLAIAAWGSLMIALELQVRFVEEPYLLRTHGEAYLRYARSTGRFVPGMGLLRSP
jgi:protein-S-isoprenylcysteine O-methyltransferase Ste14